MVKKCPRHRLRVTCWWFIQSEPVLSVAFCSVFCPPMQKTAVTKASGSPPVRAVYLAGQRYSVGLQPLMTGCRHPCPIVRTSTADLCVEWKPISRLASMIFRNDK